MWFIIIIRWFRVIVSVCVDEALQAVSLRSHYRPCLCQQQQVGNVTLSSPNVFFPFVTIQDTLSRCSFFPACQRWQRRHNNLNRTRPNVSSGETYQSPKRPLERTVGSLGLTVRRLGCRKNEFLKYFGRYFSNIHAWCLILLTCLDSAANRSCDTSGTLFSEKVNVIHGINN